MAIDAEEVKRSFPDFNVASLPATMPDGFASTVWHHDECPTWTEGHTPLAAGDLQIAAYDDSCGEVYQDASRFWLQMYDQTDNWEPLIGTDDWSQIETMVSFARYVRMLGLGFHVDTRGRDYVIDDTNGQRVFSDEEADRYDAVVDAVHAICDPYEVAIKIWNVMGFGL